MTEEEKTTPAYSPDEKMEKAVKMFENGLRSLGKGTINAAIVPTFYSCSVGGCSYTATIETGPWTGNPWGSLHGGVIATAFDSCMGIAAFYFSGERMTQTLSLDISYLRPGVLGQKLFIQSHVDKIGKEIQYITAKAWSEAHPEKNVATASGVYYAQNGVSPFNLKNLEDTKILTK